MEETIKILETFNKYRRGDLEIEDIATPKEIGIAIFETCNNGESELLNQRGALTECCRGYTGNSNRVLTQEDKDRCCKELEKFDSVYSEKIIIKEN